MNGSIAEIHGYKNKQRIFYIDYLDYEPYIKDALYMDDDIEGTWLSQEGGEDDLFLFKDDIYPNKTKAYESLVEPLESENLLGRRPRFEYVLREYNKNTKRSDRGLPLYQEAYRRDLYPYLVYPTRPNKTTQIYIDYLANKYKDIIWLESGGNKEIGICGDLGGGVFIELRMIPRGYSDIGYIDEWSINLDDYGFSSSGHRDIDRALSYLDYCISNRIDRLRDISDMLSI